VVSGGLQCVGSREKKCQYDGPAGRVEVGEAQNLGNLMVQCRTILEAQTLSWSFRNDKLSWI
jgi:hypothetical protein